ncbi:hypothetical protein HMPREF9151_00783 [Hoylesella saccharolytica F0055]|uniref:Uncharacterized protein n=1 Tax=Hoylesella saccharolytica F0055 TaxID=1127699 RepID=L1NFU4_9BACT|nr:hypothetical protein HMPREF9151_00783 [Hoylesella saccharolytica F0055]
MFNQKPIQWLLRINNRKGSEHLMSVPFLLLGCLLCFHSLFIMMKS